MNDKEKWWEKQTENSELSVRYDDDYIYVYGRNFQVSLSIQKVFLMNIKNIALKSLVQTIIYVCVCVCMRERVCM